jgi:hypothetical protein
VNLGEAAHITAAASGGPRFDPNMSSADRKSSENGIWMCRHHARLIDADSGEYSATSLRQWKQVAEATAYRELKRLQSPPEIRSTLVQVGRMCIFSGTWKRIRRSGWTFVVRDFVLGNIEVLRQYCLALNEGRMEKQDRFVVVESQGDGRVIGGPGALDQNASGETLLTVGVAGQETRRMPERIGGDIQLSPEGNMVIAGGSVARVSGKDAGMQAVFMVLSIKPGELFYYRQAGSFFSRYFWMFKHDMSLLNSVLRLEISRLATLPMYDAITPNSREVSLDFIKRVIDAEVLSTLIDDHRIPVSVTVEFTDGTQMTRQSKVYIHEQEQGGIGSP